MRAQMGLGSHMRDSRTARFAAVTSATLQRMAASCVQWALAVGELLIIRPLALSFPLLQRDLAAAAEHETSYRAPMMGDTVYDALGGGLFSDAAELTVIGSGAVAAAAAAVAVPVMEVRSKAGSKVGRTKPPLHPAAAAAAPKAAAAAKAASLPASAAADLPSLAASAPRTAEQASPFASLASSAASSPKAADAAAAAAAAAAPSLTAKPANRVSPAVGSSGKQVSAPDSGMSLGGGGSMLKTLGHSLRHMLPRPLRKFLDGGWRGCWAWQRVGAGPSRLGCWINLVARRPHIRAWTLRSKQQSMQALCRRETKHASPPLPACLPAPPALPAGPGGGTPEGSEAGEGSVVLPDDDRQLIRQELFLGHLLTLAASSGAVPPHALPSIAAMLQVGVGWRLGG